MEEATGQRVEVSQEVAAAALELKHLESPVCAHRPTFGRNHAPSRFSERTGSYGASFLRLTGPRWGRTSRSSQERVLHDTGPVSHGVGFEAPWLHAVLSIRRCAVGGCEPLQGNDLPAH